MTDNLPPGVLDPGLDHEHERWCPDCRGRVVPHGMLCEDCEAERRREAEEDDWPRIHMTEYT